MAVSTGEKLSASLEDYLEAIYNLSGPQNVARSKDIAQMLSVSRASVTGALKALSDKALIHYQRYGYVVLTEKGRLAARRIAGRHAVLVQFFGHVLGADEAAAQKAACRTEHTLGTEIAARLAAFIEFVNRQQDNGQDIARQFQKHWDASNES